MAQITVVGAGLIGRKHIDIVTKHANLVAIVDPSEAAQKLAQDLSVPWFADLDAHLQTAPPDGVIIASPNQLHLAHGLACIDANVPMLIEKPLAENAENAAILRDRAEAAGVPLLVGHHRRHSSLIKRAKSIIEGGTLGRIASVTAQFWLYKPSDYFDMDWRTKAGAGPTFINLIHDIDSLRHLCGEVTAVQAMESNAIRGFEVEDTAVVLFQFQSGALGTISLSDTIAAPWSWEMTAGENPAYPKTDMACYTIGGTDASLSIPDLQLWAHPGKKGWWHPIASDTLSCDANDPVQDQFLHFLDVISGQAPPLVSAADGTQNLRVLDAIKSAARQGRRVDV